MDQPENNQNQKKKKRLIPLIWFFGLGIAGGLITLGLLLAKKNNQVTVLEQKLSQTISNFNSEKDNLHNELQQVNADYNVLKSTNESLTTTITEQKHRNNRLSQQVINLTESEKQSKNEYLALLGSIDQLRSENGLLKNDLTRQQSESDYLRTQLKSQDSTLVIRNGLIDGQKEKLIADSTAAALMIDSVLLENSSRFINITELNGAYGLHIRSVPYSHYFYGLTNVSGLFVNKHFISGIGAGVLAYDEGLTVPLFLDFRYLFSRRTLTPYLYADGGMIFSFDNLEEPMLFINPGIGIYKSLSDKFALNLGVGFLMQRDVMAKASFINFKLGLIYIKGEK